MRSEALSAPPPASDGRNMQTLKASISTSKLVV